MPPLLALLICVLLIIGFIIFVAVKGSPKTTRMVNSILIEEDSDLDSKELIKQSEDDKRRLHDKKKKISSTVEKLSKEEEKIKNYLNMDLTSTNKKGQG